MESIWIDLGISALITLLKEKIPSSSATKKKYKKVLLKVFKAISVAYADDEDFADVVNDDK